MWQEWKVFENEDEGKINIHVEGKSYDKTLSQFVGRILFYLFHCSESQSTNEKNILMKKIL